MDETANIARGAHLTEDDIAGYLAGSLSRRRHDHVSAHMSACRDCLAAVASTYESAGPGDKRDRSIWGIMKKILGKLNPYLMLAMISFFLSFVVPRHFIQLLVATLLLGIKWIVDSKTTKMLVMIYEAWKHGGEKETSKVMERIGRQNAIRF